MAIQAKLHEKGKFSFLDLMRIVKDSEDFHKVGAIALFIGVVRGETLKGERVQKLELEAYEENANEVLTNICDNLKRREDIVDVQIHHLLGEFSVGEELVYVSVAGAHRKKVFPVLEEAVNRYKKEAPIFKKESIINQKGKKESYWTAENSERARRS